MKKILIIFLLAAFGVAQGQTFKTLMQANGIVQGSYNDTIGMITTVGVNDVEVFVYDVNGDGKLNELCNATVFVRSYDNAYIKVAGGEYDIDTCITFTVENKFDEVRGNNTHLYFRQGYTGEAVSITSLGDLTRLKISGLIFNENGTQQRNWDGIHVALGTGGDLQMSDFTDISIRNCDKAVYVVLTGDGWMNANNFTRLNVATPKKVLEVDRAGGNAGSYFDGNIFQQVQVQANTSITTDIIEDLYGVSNKFIGWQVWDADGTINGATFLTGAYNNMIIGSDLGGATFTDNSTTKSNFIDGGWEFNYTKSNFLKTDRYTHSFANTGNIVAGTGITAAMLNDVMFYNGNSAIDITANPQIADGANGQEITIIGTSGTNTLTLDPGNGLAIATQMVLGTYDMITLVYSATYDVWIETGRSDN